MRPNAKTLALRDPAIASLMGVIQGADFGADFGDDYGVEFGADPTPQNMAKAWNAQQATAKREMLLEPNRGSTSKIQRYVFAINQTFPLGVAIALAASGNPDTAIRPQRISANVTQPGVCTLSTLKVANVSVIVGGTIDANDFNVLGVDQSLDVPTLNPANKVNVTGNYTGLVPPGFPPGFSFPFAVSFKGPASITA